MLAFFLFGNIPIGKELARCKGLKEELGMKITFENAVQKSTDPITSYRTHTEHKDTVGQGKRDISDRIVNHAAYDFSKSQGIHGWNGEDLKNAAGADDVSQMHNFMAVMSNSLSDEFKMNIDLENLSKYLGTIYSKRLDIFIKQKKMMKTEMLLT